MKFTKSARPELKDPLILSVFEAWHMLKKCIEGHERTQRMTLITLTLLLTTPLFAEQDQDLTKLTQALEQLALTPETNQPTPPTQNITDPVTPEWIMATYPGIMTVIDKDRRIYQLKVLSQQPNECSFHATRNSFYLLKLFTGTRAEFKNMYDQMIDSNRYEKFMEGRGRCTKIEAVFSHDQVVRIEEIRKQVAKGALPQGSERFWDMIPVFDYYNYPKDDPDTSTQVQYISSQHYRTLLPPIEPSITDFEIEEAAATGPTYIITPIRLLHQNQNYVFCVNLGIFTVMPHSTSLLVSKQNGINSFIFANSLGSSFMDNALPSINMIVNFAQDQKRCENAYIRYGYAYAAEVDILRASLLFSTESGLEGIKQLIGKFSLTQNKLFKNIYYPAFKKLFEEAKARDKIKGESRNAAITKIEHLLAELDPQKP